MSVPKALRKSMVKRFLEKAQDRYPEMAVEDVGRAMDHFDRKASVDDNLKRMVQYIPISINELQKARAAAEEEEVERITEREEEEKTLKEQISTEFQRNIKEMANMVIDSDRYTIEDAVWMVKRDPTLSTLVGKEALSFDVAKDMLEDQEQMIDTYVAQHEDQLPTILEMIVNRIEVPLPLRVDIVQYLKAEGIDQAVRDLVAPEYRVLTRKEIRGLTKQELRNIASAIINYVAPRKLEIVERVEKAVAAPEEVQEELREKITMLQEQVEELRGTVAKKAERIETLREQREQAQQRVETLQEQQQPKPKPQPAKKEEKPKENERKERKERKEYHMKEMGPRGLRCVKDGRIVKTKNCFEPVGEDSLTERGRREMLRVKGEEIEEKEQESKRQPTKRAPPFTPTYSPSDDPPPGYDTSEWNQIIKTYMGEPEQQEVAGIRITKRGSIWWRELKEMQELTKWLQQFDYSTRQRKMERLAQQAITERLNITPGKYRLLSPRTKVPAPVEKRVENYQRQPIQRPEFLKFPNIDVGVKRRDVEALTGVNIGQHYPTRDIYLFHPGLVKVIHTSSRLEHLLDYGLLPWRLDTEHALIVELPKTYAGAYLFYDPKDPDFKAQV